MSYIYNKIIPWVGFLSLFISLSLIIIDTSILALALPSIGTSMHLTLPELQWIHNSYIISYVIFAIAMGRIADVKGHKFAFLIGVISFLAGSIICGYANSFSELIIGRVIQGFGATGIYPIVMILATELFPSHKHASVIGILSMALGINYALGPFLGGIILEFYSWHWVFLINIPICLISLAFSFFIKNTPSKKPLFMNKSSLLFLGICSISFLLSINRIASTAISGMLFTLFSLILMYLFILFEKRKKKPLLQLSLYQGGNWRLVNIIGTIYQVNNGCILLLIPLYLQNILLISPLYNGLLMLFFALTLTFMSPIAGKMMEKWGLKVPIRIYQIAGVICLMLLTIAVFIKTIAMAILISIVLAVYSGYNYAITNHLNVALLPKKMKGIGASMYASLIWFAFSVGIALASLILLITSTANLSSNLINSTIPLSYLSYFITGASPLNSLNDPYLINICQTAFETGFSTVFVITTILAIISIKYSNQLID